jgi:hypothetical protein
VSLNNRISFRDAYCAPGGGIVDLPVVPSHINDGSSDPTMEITAIESEKSQEDHVGQSAEVDEGESHGSSCYVTHFLMTGRPAPRLQRSRDAEFDELGRVNFMFCV